MEIEITDDDFKKFIELYMQAIEDKDFKIVVTHSQETKIDDPRSR